MSNNYDVTLEEVKESLGRLRRLLEVISDGSSTLSEYQSDLVDQFLICNEQIEGVLNDYYWAGYSDQEVPEEDRASTVLAELVSEEKIPVGHVADLFDQFTSAAVLAKPYWAAAQPPEGGLLQETLEKMPLYYQRMMDLVVILESEPPKLVIDTSDDQI